jgi:hypothetical protein
VELTASGGRLRKGPPGKKPTAKHVLKERLRFCSTVDIPFIMSPWHKVVFPPADIKRASLAQGWGGGSTPFHLAASNGHREVDLLLPLEPRC